MKREGRGTPHQSPGAIASPRGSLRTKKRICIAVGAVCLLAMLGIIGGMELGDIPVLRGAALAGGCEAVSAAALWKAWWLRWRS